jgi:3',5'-cyclic AMP phosphodiesterase CpdA
MTRSTFLLLIAGLAAAPVMDRAQAPALQLTLPLKPGSVRFAIIGDSGTGESEQYQVAEQMARYHASFPFDFVTMLGDNIYGSKTPADYKRKFEDPYKPLLDAGVKFYAALGNHDDPNARFYKPFNMGGRRYYSFKKGNVTFLALDSNYMDPDQITWLVEQLSESNSAWKICYFHHPFYTHARFHGADVDLRAKIEPLFIKAGVNLVLTGHQHVYERIKPQKGIYYFVLGNAGELRYRDLQPSPETIKGFDTDRDFMLMEIAGDDLYFQTISRTGETVDSGVLPRQSAAANTSNNQSLEVLAYAAR